MLNLKAVQVKQFKEQNKITELFAFQKNLNKNYGRSKSHYEIHPMVYYIMYSKKQKKLIDW